jgi:hypothetical protein
MGYVSLAAVCVLAASLVAIYLARVWQIEMVSRRRAQAEHDTRLLSYAASTSNAFLVRVGALEERFLIHAGVHPHHIDPKKWMPGGMSREVWELAQKAEKVPASPTEIEADGDEYRRRLEQDRLEWEAIGKQPASDPLG